jgi:hypothetical protein
MQTRAQFCHWHWNGRMAGRNISALNSLNKHSNNGSREPGSSRADRALLVWHLLTILNSHLLNQEQTDGIPLAIIWH